ncbi:MAG: hypothetical protein A3F43_04915 [Gammaproteobacteria bacterium RIFCSPHIGHO2_12_FULL_42_10]|nr:MAG: hypothetical protein A3F43_04915 [Gammaproteobacteria bacterium RIFCSPHIGHO2_12_FULL_42_10]
MESTKRKVNGRKLENESGMVLKKHVGLIHCENKLSLMQRKICNILLFNALDTLHNQEIHQISLRKLCSLIGFNSHDIQLIKQSIKRLIAVVMEWNLLDDSKFLNEGKFSEDGISWHASSLLAGASIKSGIIQYSYSPQIKSILSSLELYGRINLFVQAKFNSNYSLVLYENCARFKNIKQTAWFPLAIFRSLMGVPKDKYTEFKEFKRNVINIAVKEINQKSDICVEPQFKKMGKNIIAIQFLLSENKQYHPAFKRISSVSNEKAANAPTESVALMGLLADFKLTDSQMNEIVNRYEHDYILEKVRLVRTKKKIEHPGAYLMAALHGDYQVSSPTSPVLQSQTLENTCLREAKVASEIQSLKRKYMLYKVKRYEAHVKQQSSDLQGEIQTKFEKYLSKQDEVLRLYRKSGLLSPFVIANFIEFIEKQFADFAQSCLAFDDYITSEDF